MCRYAIHSYKPHYACFHCRKSYKRRLLQDIIDGDHIPWQNYEARCPQCSHLMANMGMDFEAPRQTDTQGWKRAAGLYTMGHTFHSCGCSGPGYRPRDRYAYTAYLEEVMALYNNYLEEHKRTTPKTDETFAAIAHWESRIAAVAAAIQADKNDPGKASGS